MTDGVSPTNPYRVGWENFLRHVVTGAPMQADLAAGIRDVQFARGLLSQHEGSNVGQPRTALVTGTSTGIGQAIAIALARDGYDLALTELDIDALKETLAHPDIKQRKVVPLALDLRSRESINAAFADARARLGDIDLLVNNAGRALVKPSRQRHRRRLGRRDEHQPQGRVLPVAAVRPRLHQRQAARLHRQHGLDPRHDRHRRARDLRHLQGRPDPDDPDAGGRMGRQGHPRQRGRAGDGDDAVAREDAEGSGGAAGMLARIPIGRFVTPEEVAAAVVYLASDGAAAVTGHTLMVDGAVTAI